MDGAARGSAKPPRLLAAHPDLVDRSTPKFPPLRGLFRVSVSKTRSNAAPQSVSLHAIAMSKFPAPSSKNFSARFTCKISASPPHAPAASPPPGNFSSSPIAAIFALPPLRFFAARPIRSPLRTSPIRSSPTSTASPPRRPGNPKIARSSAISTDAARSKPGSAPFSPSAISIPFAPRAASSKSKTNPVRAPGDEVPFRERVTPIDSASAFPNPAHDSSPDPHRSRYLALFSDALHKAFKALDPQDLRRLRFYYADQQTLAHIGRELGEHESSVSRNLDRIRRELRAAVESSLRSGQFQSQNGTYPQPALNDEQIALCFEYAAEDAPINFDQVFPPAPSVAPAATPTIGTTSVPSVTPAASNKPQPPQPERRDS